MRCSVHILGFVCVGVSLLIASATISPRPIFIWNASASVPIGLYIVRPAHALRVGDLVLVAPPDDLAGFLDRGGYLPKGVPLLKHVLALSDQTVCRADMRIMIDGRAAGDAQRRDSRGRLLPSWQGCHVLAADEVFLMNKDVPTSLDGRYFGAMPIIRVIGKAAPVWTTVRH